jgi:hypothetical protein
MHSGDFQKKAPRPAASFFVYNGTMPEVDEEQREVQEGARVRRWRPLPRKLASITNRLRQQFDLAD